VSTSLLVSTGAVSCYCASMVNFVWFTDEKCLLYQHLATCGHEIKHLMIQKLNHFANSVCWCTVLIEDVKIRLSTQVCKSDCFGCFCGCNSKTFNSLSSVNQIKFTIDARQLFSNFSHWL